MNEYCICYINWDEVYMYLHVFGATQLMYGSVTLARCAALPYE